MDDEVATMLDHAREFLDAARANATAGRRAVAFDEARHAAEVTAKALYLKAIGQPLGKSHTIAGALAQQGLLPTTAPEKKWVRFLHQHTRASYGYFETFSDAEVQQAIGSAAAMLQAAESYPDGSFHPARTP